MQECLFSHLERLLFCCLALCVVRFAKCRRTSCLALALRWPSHRLAFMDSQAQSYGGLGNCANDLRTSSEFLHCIEPNILGDLPSYTELGSQPPHYKVFGPSVPALPFDGAQRREVSPLLDLNQRSPWWETEARTILLGQDFQSIELILQFRLYGHKDALRDVLRRRWECKLDRILSIIPHTESKDDPVTELKKDQKVEEILERVEPRHPVSLPWSWKPYK